MVFTEYKEGIFKVPRELTFLKLLGNHRCIRFKPGLTQLLAANTLVTGLGRVMPVIKDGITSVTFLWKTKPYRHDFWLQLTLLLKFNSQKVG